MKKGQKVMVTQTLTNNFEAGEIVTCIGAAQGLYAVTDNVPYAHRFSNGKIEQDLSPDEYVLIQTPFMRRLFAQLFNK
jgi:hypothetical protein